VATVDAVQRSPLEEYCDPGGADPGRHETPDQRDDRNLQELLQELRVAAIGVQVLFGFLLALPFTVRFASLDGAQRDLYLASLGAATAATALLLGPVSFHRIVFRHHEKHRLVAAANLMALGGLVSVCAALVLSVALVTTMVARGASAAVATGVFALFVGLWFAVPVVVSRSAARPLPTRR